MWILGISYNCHWAVKTFYVTCSASAMHAPVVEGGGEWGASGVCSCLILVFIRLINDNRIWLAIAVQRKIQVWFTI